eukprot:366332-Pleurochrysis_carterae.AAC.1
MQRACRTHLPYMPFASVTNNHKLQYTLHASPWIQGTAQLPVLCCLRAFAPTPLAALPSRQPACWRHDDVFCCLFAMPHQATALSLHSSTMKVYIRRQLPFNN